MSIKHYSLFTLFALILLFSSCTNEQEINVSTDVFKLDTTLNLPLDSIGITSAYYAEVTFEDKSYLACTNFNINAIELYDHRAEQPSLYKRIVFPKEGDRGIGHLVSFIWVNADSIYTFTNKKNRSKVCLVNAKGEFITTVIKRNLGDKYFILPYSLCDPIIHNGLLFNMRHYIVPSESITDNDHVEDVIRLADSQKQAFKSPLPKESLLANAPTMLLRRNRGAGTTLVSSYSHNHNIYITDMEQPTAGYIDIIEAKSIHYQATTPYRSDMEKDEFYKWRLRNASYEGIYYDQYREVYYRLVSLPSEHLKDPITGEPYDLYHELPFSIMVLDKNLKLIGEQKFPIRTYNHFEHPLFILPEGLYISLNSPYNEHNSEDTASFQLLKLKPEILAKRP